MDRATTDDLRETYLETVATRLEPPQFKWFFQQEGYEDEIDLKRLITIAKTGNWMAHWRRRKIKWARAQEEVAAEENSTITLARSGSDFNTKATEQLGQMIADVERLMPQVLNELEARLEVMDDKSLVATAKLLQDLRSTAVKTVERRYDQEREREVAAQRERDTLLAELGLGHRLLDILEGKEVPTPEVMDAEDAARVNAFAELDKKVL